jgi:hypothetical protein
LDFCSLQHLPVSEVYWSGRVPNLPSCRLQGLATLLTVYSLRNLVGLVSCPQRSWDWPLRSFHSFAGHYSVSGVTHPHAVSSTPYTSVELLHGSVDRGSWVLPPAKSPGFGADLAIHSHQVASLGFSFLGFYRRLTLASLRKLSSHVLCLGRVLLPANAPPALQSFYRSATGGSTEHRSAKHCLNPSKVRAPFRSLALRHKNTGL